MLTDRRLMEAYSNAKLETFDENSKYIFFSDSHRGDNSLSDEFSRNQNIFIHALEHYYSNGFTYVEAGDGDELWEYTKFRHIRLAHSDVFKTLKKYHDSNRFILLWGNHNLFLASKDYIRKNYFKYYDEYTEEQCDLFDGLVAYEALVLRHKNTGQEILTVHGHQGDYMNDKFWFGSMLLLRYFWRFMHLVGFQNPSSPAKNVNKMHKIERKYNKWIKKHNRILICGHTHRPKFPLTGELPYFNTGCCIHARGITGIEIEKDMISLVEWKLRPDSEGVIRIERGILKGPEPIKKFRA